jgi:aminotransferase
MLPTNLAASIGIVQLDRTRELQEYRKKIWKIYTEEFSQVDGLSCPPDAEAHETHSYFTYVIRVKNRDALARHLYEKGIYTTLRYHPLHLNKIYNSRSVLPNCERLNEEALNIPLHPNLSMEDVGFIVDTIRQETRGMKKVPVKGLS